MRKSIIGQEQRLKRAGYQSYTINQVTQKLIRKLIFGKDKSNEEEAEGEKKRIAVINYDHGISHRMMKVGQMFDIKVVFAFPHKLSTLPSSINRMKEPCKTAKSTHTQFRACKKEVVYKIPLSCGAAYIGQTKKCINERLTEHMRSKKQEKEEYKNLCNHTNSCGCKPDFTKTTLLGDSGRSRLAREILEAFWIKHEHLTTVSEPSIKLMEEEYLMLESAGYQKRLRKTEKRD